MKRSATGNMTLANKITILRIVLIPVFIIGLLQRASGWPIAIFSLMMISDILDGAAARHRGERTLLGSFLDPVADKLLLVSTYMALVHLGYLPMWVFIVVFSRDLLIFLGWNILSILTRNMTVTPRWPGKATTFLQMAAVITLLVPPLSPIASFTTLAMAAATVVSAVDYVWVGAQKLNQIG